jgi:hypothetical protein
MGQSFWEASNRSAGQEIPPFMEPEGSLPFSEEQFLSQANPVYTLIQFFI